ncbi:MAG: SEC59/DGK1/VTE5 family protein [Myxococcota bacterium]
MDIALRLESQRLAEEVYALIQQLDPAVWRAEFEEAAQQRIEHIKARAAALLAEYTRRRDEGSFPGIEDALRRVNEIADEMSRRALDARRDLNGKAGEVKRLAKVARREWRAAFKRLQPAYGELAGRLGSLEIEVPKLRPTNIKRSLVHALSGVLALVSIQFFMNRTGLIVTAGSLTLLAAFLEIGRRISPAMNAALMRGLGPIAHPHEYTRVNSATWYASSLLILSITIPDLVSASVAVLVLALADPAAATVGRRFGRVKLFANRSLEGSLTFFGVAFLATLGVLGNFGPEMLSFGSACIVAAIAALIGAVVELFTRGIDDNFTIPLGVGFATYGALALVV